MALTKYTKDTAVIENVGTKPEDRTTLNDLTFKQKWDENATDWKAFWNGTASEEIDALITAIRGAGWTSESLKGLADLISTNDGKLTTHKAENVAFQTIYTFTSAGGTYDKTVTISLPIAPKSINIFACVEEMPTASHGNWSQNAAQNCIYQRTSDYKWKYYPSAVVHLADVTGGDYLLATVSAMTTTSITLSFNEYAGSFAGQTIVLVVTALTH
jgi:hypothetical protein